LHQRSLHRLLLHSRGNMGMRRDDSAGLRLRQREQPLHFRHTRISRAHDFVGALNRLSRHPLGADSFTLVQVCL
jgi:hypothetical protein